MSSKMADTALVVTLRAEESGWFASSCMPMCIWYNNRTKVEQYMLMSGMMDS